LLRIAYLVQLDLSLESGVIKKVLSQMRMWDACSHEVRLFVMAPNAREWSGLANVSKTTAVYGSSLLGRLKASRWLEQMIRAWNPDVVYMRYGTYHPPWRRLCRLFPTVVEINTNETTEYRLVLSRLKYAYHRLTGRIILNNAAGLVFVTHELSLKHACYSAVRKVIPNGMELSSVQHRDREPKNNSRKQLVFMGSPGCPWHGADMIPPLARELPDCDFHVVGYSAEDIGKNLPGNLEVHGHLSRQQYDTILRSSDVAIGSLALNRIGLQEACPLKTREYLAYGLPVITGYDDSDFPDNTPYILRLNMVEHDWHEMGRQIREFVTEWTDRCVPRQAIGHIDAGIKERNRLLFMQEVIREWNEGSPV